MKTRIISGAFALLAATGAQAACPPNASDFDTWTWISANSSGDNWVNALVCSSAAQRTAVTNLVVSHLGLDENWDYWEDMLTPGKICDPNKWGGRTINGGYATELVGIHRDNDSFSHFASPGGILPNGNPVKYWLSQYSDLYISDEGYEWECLADDDAGGPGDGFTFASNPFDNSACTFYFPWFWNKTVMDRASTIVHEATHEFEGHIANSACTNGGSCDDVFMNANAQSFQIIFDAQAVDAYQRQPNSRELTVVNFGNNVCGYLPLLPDLDRFALQQVMQNKLQTCFQTVPPTSQYPASAVLDSVPGTIYDLAGNPGGQANVAYRIDITNSSRWPCGQVCSVSDYTWNPNGGSGSKACNETWQPGNAQRNAFNRNRCNQLNAEVAAGVTQAEHTSLRAQVNNTMQGCLGGVSDDYLNQVCDALLPNVDHVDDIDNGWPLPDNIGYGYNAEEAIKNCQTRFCGRQDIQAWDADAREVCYEWDDPAGCMDVLCPVLDSLDPDPGRDSQAYLEAVICRASELGRNIPGIRDEDVGCEAVYNDCTVRERYLPLWQNQLAGDDCWSDSLPQATPDPYFRNLRGQLMRASTDRAVVLDRGAGLMVSSCLLEEAQCEAMQAAFRAIMARLAKLRTRPEWQGPPGPDPWERFEGYFDREFDLTMQGIGAELLENPRGAPLFLDARLRRAGAMPEAQVALAEAVGLDTYFRAGGLQYANAAIFSPERLNRFAGANAERDPYTPAVEGFENEIEAMATLTTRLNSRQWNALIARSNRLGAAAYHGHMQALLASRTGVELLAAHDALMQDLQR